MRSLLARRWFLLVLVLTVGWALLDAATIRRVVEPVPPRLAVMLTLFCISWTLASRQLGRSLVRPGPALWAVVISYGLLPPLGWLSGQAVSTLDYRIGLLIITSAPCTLASAVIWTRLAGGDEAVALLVTMLTTGASWLITTSWLTLTTGLTAVANPAGMMGMLVLALIVPVAAGQAARYPVRLRELAERLRTPLGVVAQLLILAVILQGVVQAVQQLQGTPWWEQSAGLAGVAGLSMAMHMIALVTGYASGWLFGFDRSSRIAIAFAGSQKSLPVSLLIANLYYAEYDLAVIPLLFYHIGQLFVDTWVADQFRGAKCKERRAESGEPGMETQ